MSMTTAHLHPEIPTFAQPNFNYMLRDI